MNPLYPKIATRAEHRCEYCRAPEVVFNFPFEVEHIVPPSRGGANDVANQALACRSCNAHKSDFLESIDPETQIFARLFHPRLDPWKDHFRLDLVSGAVVGLSSIGRATVARLQFNYPAQLDARRLWIRFGMWE